MKEPLVSICCITFNHKEYIEKCLEGFVMQKTNFDFEILVFDDASTDGTKDIIDNFSRNYDNFRLFLQEENQWSQGRYGLIDFLFPQAKGKYIALCEGDDYWTDPYKLQKQVDFLEDNDEYGLVHTNYFEYYEKNNKIEKHKSCNFSRADENRYYLKTGDIRTLTVLFRSKFIAEIKVLFDQEFMKNAVIGDRPIFLLISSTSKIKFFDEIMGTYRISATNSASHFSDLFKYYNFLYQTSVLNQNLYNYFKIEACNNSKQILFLKTVLLLKDSTLKGTYKFITNGLLFSNFREFYSILKFKLFFFKK